MAAQVVVAADAATVDENLRRGLHMLLGLEGVGLLARCQPAIVDCVALAPQQEARLQAEGAGVLGHDHAVQRGGLVGGGVVGSSGGHGELRRSDRSPDWRAEAAGILSDDVMSA
ncbi:hypothetical protein FQZ97_766600 [compost metagenome]